MAGKATWKPLELLLPRKTVNQKEYIPQSRNHCKVNTTIKDWKGNPGQLSYLACAEDRQILENKSGLSGAEAAGEVTAALATVVLLLEHIHGSPGTWEAAADLAGTVLSTPAANDPQIHFAFSWRGQQHTSKVLSQGYSNSPALHHKLVWGDLD